MKKSLTTNIIQNCTICNIEIPEGTGKLYKGKFLLCPYCADSTKKIMKHSVSFFLKVNSNFREMFKLFGWSITGWPEDRYKKLSEFRKAIYEK